MRSSKLLPVFSIRWKSLSPLLERQRRY